MNEQLFFTQQHQWIRINGTEGVIGITQYAAEQLDEILFLELPDVGVSVKSGEKFGCIESVKSTSDVYSPMSGKIVAVNQDLLDLPDMVSNKPYSDGWLIKIDIQDKSEIRNLLSREEYDDFISRL